MALLKSGEFYNTNFKNYCYKYEVDLGLGAQRAFRPYSYLNLKMVLETMIYSNHHKIEAHNAHIVIPEPGGIHMIAYIPYQSDNRYKKMFSSSQWGYS